MPKVLRIINRFNLGGPTYNATYLSGHLAPQFETLLIGGPNEENEESSLHIPEQAGIDPTIIRSMQRSLNPVSDYKAYKEIRKIIRQYQPDIVHTHASKAGAVGRLAALHSGVPVIVHTFHGHVFHSYFGKFKTAFYKNLERYLASKSQSIIAISEKQKEELCRTHRICPEEKVTVINLGFELEAFRRDTDKKRKLFREEYQLMDDELAIGIIGRLVPIKNHRLFLDALSIVLEQTTQKVKAFVIGDGEEKAALLQYAREKGITTDTRPNPNSKLIFTSWIKDVDRALSGIDIVALTSLNEGTPVSIIEAQASSKPVVSTNVGGIADIVIPGETAILTDCYDHKKFAMHLLQLTEDQELRLQMQQKGWAFVKDRFSVENLAGKMSAHYQKLLSSNTD